MSPYPIRLFFLVEPRTRLEEGWGMTLIMKKVCGGMPRRGVMLLAPHLDVSA